MTQLQQLAEPFPPGLIKAPPKGKYGEYVPHSAVTERLLAVVGPFTQRVTEIIRNHDTGMIDGCILELSFEIDNKWVTVQEVGDVENPAMKKTDGARLKDAVSDAVKRCAMRAGLGLHLWSQDDYFLDSMLEDSDE